MQFGYTIIYVSDVAKTIAFYQQAFGCEVGFVDPEGDYAQLKTGETTLAFAQDHFAHTLTDLGHYENKSDTIPAGFEITFLTDDVVTAFSTAVAHGAVAIKEPAITPWNQTVGYLRDCNGVLIEIATPIPS
jgi:lactoylglutathione lyase